MKPFLILLLSFNWFSGLAQQPSFLTNPSFEGNPGMGILPPGWKNCALNNQTPPDVFPATDGLTHITKKAFDGDTYLGMVIRENVTTESVGQKLSATLAAGQCYSFSLHLCLSDVFVNTGAVSKLFTSFSHPAVLRIWGGNSLCGKKMLLAESPPVDNYDWKKYTFQFRVLDTISYLMLEAFFMPGTDTAYNGHILVDNASPIIPLNCNGLEPMLDTDTLNLPEFSYRKLTEPVAPQGFMRVRKLSGNTWTELTVASFSLVNDPAELEGFIQKNCPHIGFKIGQSSLENWESYPLEEIALNVRQFKNYSLAAALVDRGEKLNKKRIKSLKRAFRFGKLPAKQYRIEIVSIEDEMLDWLCGQNDVWLRVERA